jgi:hypothetical protein
MLDCYSSRAALKQFGIDCFLLTPVSVFFWVLETQFAEDPNEFSAESKKLTHCTLRGSKCGEDQINWTKAGGSRAEWASKNLVVSR